MNINEGQLDLKTSKNMDYTKHHIPKKNYQKKSMDRKTTFIMSSRKKLLSEERVYRCCKKGRKGCQERGQLEI